MCVCFLVQGQDSVNKITSAAPVTEKPVKEEWAIMVDVTEPVKDFHKRVPVMAHKVRYYTFLINIDSIQAQARNVDSLCCYHIFLLILVQRICWYIKTISPS